MFYEFMTDFCCGQALKMDSAKTTGRRVHPSMSDGWTLTKRWMDATVVEEILLVDRRIVNRVHKYILFIHTLFFHTYLEYVVQF